MVSHSQRNIWKQLAFTAHIKMYNINSEATVAAFIDLQKCELETELEVLYLSKGLQKTAGDTPWLHFPIKKPHNTFF